VLDARVALISAQTTELQARYEYNAALAELDRVTGSTTRFHTAAPAAPAKGRQSSKTPPPAASPPPQPVAPSDKTIRAVSHRPAGRP